MSSINTFTETAATRWGQIFQLSQRLTDEAPDLDDEDPKLTIRSPDVPDVIVTCHRRAEDGDELWFFFGPADPICEASNIADAAIAVRGRIQELRELARLVPKYLKHTKVLVAELESPEPAA